VDIVVTADAPELVHAELLAVPFTGTLSAAATRLDASVEGGLSRLVAAGEASAEAGKLALLHSNSKMGLAAARIALVGLGGAANVDDDAVRAAAAAAASSLRNIGGTVAWVFDPELGIDTERQVTAIVEGTLLGEHDPARWKTDNPIVRADRVVIAGAPPELNSSAARAATIARWTNRARELVDAPPNEITPEGLARSTTAVLDGLPVDVEVHTPDEPTMKDLRALSLVGKGSSNQPRLIVVRYRAGPPHGDVLALVGKAVTFDSGGLFLKPREDIVRQKADMAGGAAVIAAIGAIAELELPLQALAVIPAAENMIGAAAYRPGDIFTTAAGLTVEVTNPDAEGRLILADALWYARQQGATHLVDIATLTGAMRSGMGDMYTGVFANRDDWRARLVDAGAASGDHAWPWPLHTRYRRLLDSRLADLRNTAGRNFGYPIVAATFLAHFVGETPWAHLDILSTAYLDEQRDYLAPGATGAGVRLLTELATQMSQANPNGE
jgi:leucyl aminopeptidase